MDALTQLIEEIAEEVKTLVGKELEVFHIARTFLYVIGVPYGYLDKVKELVKVKSQLPECSHDQSRYISGAYDLTFSH